MTGTCTRCHHTGRLARSDLCKTCYQQLWRAGTLPPAPHPARHPHPPIDCTHERRHQHGTRTAYVVDRCRCDACTEANRDWARDHARQAAAAAWDPTLQPYVSGDIVRAHIAQLRAAGMGRRAIAAAAGLAESTLCGIMHGYHADDPNHPHHRPPRLKVRREVAERILSVTFTPAPHAVVDATGTRRRMQALVAVGWSQARLASRLGITETSLCRILAGSGGVLQATADAAAAAYEEWWRGPSAGASRAARGSITRARQHAARQGWLPPLAWDDDTIDDPDTEPHTGPALAGRAAIDARTAARIEDARELLTLGEDPVRIADRLEVPLDSLAKLLARRAPDIAAPFARAKAS